MRAVELRRLRRSVALVEGPQQRHPESCAHAEAVAPPAFPSEIAPIVLPPSSQADPSSQSPARSPASFLRGRSRGQRSGTKFGAGPHRWVSPARCRGLAGCPEPAVPPRNAPLWSRPRSTPSRSGSSRFSRLLEHPQSSASVFFLPNRGARPRRPTSGGPSSAIFSGFSSGTFVVSPVQRPRSAPLLRSFKRLRLSERPPRMMQTHSRRSQRETSTRIFRKHTQEEDA